MRALLGAVVHALVCPVQWATVHRARVPWEHQTLILSDDVLRRLGPRCRRCGRPSV